ncbi:MAG: carboxypeptidase-like regulatory domain-containing protein [Spirosomaceae bacterium]|nr:carboxypeptidase-like regulatory domain-containing protein [Spirosomataceae bacterium]
MKNILLVLLLISSFTANAQVSVTLKDSLTKQPVSYANIWVLGENIGTTADERGNFTLNNSAANKRIAISCVGFDRKEILFNADLNTIYLKRADNLLKEVSVTPRLRDKRLVVGKLSKRKDNSYHSNVGYPWISGRFFPFNEKYNQTPYMETITCFTAGSVKNSKFSIRIYDVNNEGIPGKILHATPIYGFAKKAKSFTKIDISQLNLKIPKNGVVIGLEWLIIDENKFDFEYYDPSKPKLKIKRIQYSPSFISTKLTRNEIGWMYSRGEWRKIINQSDSIRKIPNSAPAIELTLSN